MKIDPQFIPDLVTLTKEILNWKLLFLDSASPLIFTRSTIFPKLFASAIVSFLNYY